MEDLNSSDIEFEPAPNPFVNAGRQSILAMMDHALEDRIASKRAVKALTLTKGAPSTQYHRALWWNRFTEFRRQALGKEPDVTPSGEDLERFLSTIVGHVKPQTNQVPSYSWLKSGIGYMLENCIFHHKSFTLSPHERTRISALTQTLLQQGKVTKDASRERNWAGVVVVRKLVSSLISQAFEEGTMTWDITIARCLSIVLVSALGVRTGDVTVAPSDKHSLPYLIYKDIVIRLKDGSGIDDLDAVVTIRNEKGNKQDPKKKRVVLLKALKSPSDSIICPIKLLLVLALRFGNVAETTIDDLIKHTAQRKNRTVLWRFPERPVLCAFVGRSSVQVEKPAGNHQLTHTTSQAALAAGLLNRIRAHDLRRGAARDTANLSAKGRGLADQRTAALLGHNQGASNTELTALYVGDLAEDVWTQRVSENFIDPMYETPQAENAYQRRFKPLRSAEITEVLISEGLGTVAHKDRVRGGKILEKRRQDDWADQENEKRQMLTSSYLETPHPTIRETLATPEVLDVDATSNTIADGEIPIDPQLLQQSQELCDVMIGEADGAADPEIEGLLLDTVQGIVPPTKGIQWSDSLSFARLFSTINITCNQELQQWGTNKKTSALKEKALSLLQGNSRDTATSFIYACKNNIHGCTYSNGFRVAINEHERTCSIISREAFDDVARKEAAKTFPCTEEGCSKIFSTVGKRNRHVVDMHGWPKPCPKGCEIDPLPNRNAMVRHMETHSEFTPTRCRVPGCQSQTVFERSKIYRNHIKKVHNILGKDMDPYMPFTKKAKFEPTKCQVDGCTNKTIYSMPNKYKTHLRNGHEMGEDEVEFYADAAGC